MERLPVALHIQLHAVQDDEWLGVCIDGADASNEHGSTVLQVARMHIDAHVATQPCGHFLINGEAVAVGGEAVGGGDIGAIFVHGREGIAEHADAQLLGGIACDNGHLLREVLRCLHIQGRSKGWNLYGELAVGIGHGGIPVVVEGLQAHTGNRLLSGIIDHGALYVNGWIGVNNLGALRRLDGGRSILVIKFVLGKSH